MVVSSRVKQGRVLSPLLLNSVMVAVTTVSGKCKRIVENYKKSFSDDVLIWGDKQSTGRQLKQTEPWISY
jgi:hypothetical protein